MPCSCKSHVGNIVLLRPASSKGLKQVDIQHFKQKVLKASSDSFSASFDFTPTVKPDQVCFNCAMKHMGFASVLLQQNTSQDFILAAAEVAQAGSHYMNFDPTLASLYQQLAQRMIVDYPDKRRHLKHFKKLLQTAFKLFLGQEIILDNSNNEQQNYFGAQEIFVEILKQLGTAYSLLYAQLGYEDINRMYAVGALVHAADQAQALQMFSGIRPKIRELWKIVQEAHNTHQQREQARQRLLALIRQTLHLYQVFKAPVQASDPHSRQLREERAQLFRNLSRAKRDRTLNTPQKQQDYIPHQ